MHNQGFSLVEIMLAVVIFSLMVGLILNVFIFSQKLYRQTETELELLQNGRIVLERISRDLRQAEEMVTALPQVPDNPDNPPLQEIEFQDGHNPSPYAGLGSDYYYIRYYLNLANNEVYRQYRVYCFDPCETCTSYFRWNDSRLEGEELVTTHACDLEDRIIGEYLSDLRFWGLGTINISLVLNKSAQTMNLQTSTWGRNL